MMSHYNATTISGMRHPFSNLYRLSQPSTWNCARHEESSSGVALFDMFIFLASFYILGYAMGNPKATKRTIMFAAAMFVMDNRAIRADLADYVPAVAYMYMSGVLAFQLVVAVLLDQTEKLYTQRYRYEDHGQLKPLLYPCRTTHRRMFPSKHSFSYSYLFAGIPVGWEGTSGTLLSTGGTSSKGWFTVHSDDYLARGSHHKGLRGKLHDYLSSQDVSRNEYPSAYLVTAPRFLGFSFNPVSFWYLYDRDNRLAAMILEVNNTFDERRAYFMKLDPSELPLSKHSLRSSWSKDFHVSPFNDRDGSYSVTAKDPVADHPEARVDNTIVLRSEDGRAKIIARVYSADCGADPSKMSTFMTWWFVTRWWWVIFMTNPRIIRQAGALWAKGLKVFYRPEVLESSIGRQETAEEQSLEPHFRALLAELVTEQSEFAMICYTPAAGPDTGKTIDLAHPRAEKTAHVNRVISVKILTPAFYTEIVRAQFIGDAFSRFCFDAKPGETMLSISDHSAFDEMLQAFHRRYHTLPPSKPQPYSLHNGAFFLSVPKIILAIVQGRNRSKVLSPLDEFIKRNRTEDDRKAYSRLKRRVMLTDRIAFGVSGVLEVYTYLACFLLVHLRLSLLKLSWLQFTASYGALLSFATPILIYHCTDIMLSNEV